MPKIIMKNFLLFLCLVFVTTFNNCGPAAEDRQQMMARSKVFQDSIANFIRTTMAEAEAPGNAPIIVAPSPTAQSTPTPGK